MMRLEFTMRVWNLCLLAASLQACGPDATPETPSVGDTDGDSILDVHEGNADPDLDGVPAYRDLDSDGDGLRDALEAGDKLLLTLPRDADGDGLPDFLDTDSDDNGILDQVEGFNDQYRPRDTDRDGVVDSSDLDDDNDTVPDIQEMSDGDRNTDRDGVPDRLDSDSDGDRIGDRDEAWCYQSGLCDTDSDGTPDLRDEDSDGDGLPDLAESGAGETEQIATPPQDTDQDGTYDARDLDADGDGLADAMEAVGPTDGVLWDTDGDGLSDGLEASLGFDPADATSRWEGRIVYAPPRHSGEFVGTVGLTSARVDVVLDPMPATTEHRAPGVIDALRATVPEGVDLGIAVATAGTYASYPWGCREEPLLCGWEEDEIRFITSPQPAVWTVLPLQTDLDYVYARLSKDTSGPFDKWWFYYSGTANAVAPYEFLFQVATGRGYDLNCDGVFDIDLDLAPWPRGPGDLFDGTSVDPVRLGTRLGPIGSLGLREGSHRIYITAWDGTFGLRMINPGAAIDPATAPEAEVFYTAPDTLCPAAATAADVVGALREARFSIVSGPSVSCHDLLGGDCSMMPDPLNQSVVLPQLAREIGSVWDPDGDGETEPYRVGTADELRALQGDFTPEEKRDYYATRLAPILADIVGTWVDPKAVAIELRGNASGIVTGFTPRGFADPTLGDVLDFEVTWVGAVPPKEADQGEIVTFVAIGDGHTHLGQTEILMVVPGWGRVE